ncbi:MAG: alcohol dehydrogenase catalytic domain-containing protein [Longimicrobiales bacterium]
MKAAVLHELTDLSDLTDRSDPYVPLSPEEVPDPGPRSGELLVRVSACGVCHTELDEIEGRTPPPELPVIPGHQVVGRIEAIGEGTGSSTGTSSRASSSGAAPQRLSSSDVPFHSPEWSIGDRVGVAWIYHACGACRYCRDGLENLCPEFMATGRDADGGYAEYMTVPAAFAHPIPEGMDDIQAAPLLCAGAIGYRSLRLSDIEDGQRLGLTGFGASGHLVLKLAVFDLPETDVFVFARSPAQREFALELGAAWAGDTEDEPPELLDAIIDTTPAWKPVVDALGCLAPGGRLVINAIRKEAGDQEYLQELDYPDHLWMEKEIKNIYTKNH